uniref:Glycoprotein hormone subunit beta domain-containing protein n=1 Tax=Cyprinus carpio TaxID=7962 RepID=A0A8C2KXF5_CYPCA
MRMRFVVMVMLLPALMWEGSECRSSCRLTNISITVESEECGSCITIDTTACAGLCKTQNQVYDVRILDGKVYINPHSTLSLCLIPVTKITHQDSLPVEINFLRKNTLHVSHQNPSHLRPTGKGFFEASPPTQPNRKDNLTVMEPGIIKRGKGGTLRFRCAPSHSVQLCCSGRHKLSEGVRGDLC